MRFVLWLTTLLRVGLIPVFVWVASGALESALPGGDAATRWTALAILFAMGLSDVLDGLIARRYDLQTQLGAIVDAAVDKLVQFVLVTYFTFGAGPVFTPLPLWFLVILFGADAVGLVGWLALRVRHGPFDVIHRAHGRIVTLAVFLVLGGATVGAPRLWLLPLLALTAILAVVSVTAYGFEGRTRASAQSATTDELSAPHRSGGSPP